MASYFDLPPQDKGAASNIEAVPEKERKRLGGSSLLSPAVTQLLDDLGDEESDSNSEEASLSEETDTKRPVELTKGHDPYKSQSNRAGTTSNVGSAAPRNSERSAKSRLGPSSSPLARGGEGKRSKPKQPHMARFHSLRSMLFTSTLENKMEQVKQDEHQEQEAASRWKNQHDQRQMNRPKTPEKDAQGKDKFGTRIKTKLRRMTSKEASTLDTLNEDGAAHDFSDHGSTASSDAEDEREPRGYRDTDEESIDHSDVEDLVRWVSRRDPPSDGEARVANKVGVIQEAKDSGHESLGNSDVEDLVRWVSTRSTGPEKEQELPTNYSEVSTEDDSELERGRVSSEDEDADDLMRWISHRDGPNAGPVRKQQPKQASDADEHITYDSDVPELGRWVRRHDGTSGESAATTPIHEAEDPLQEPERGRPRSRDRPLSREARNHITDDDIGDLVRWVSRNDSKQEDSPEPDDNLKQFKRQEEAKQHAIGMSVDEGSLSHSDVKDLITHVKSNEIKEEAIPTIQVSSAPLRPGAGESGVFQRQKTMVREAKKPAAQEYLAKSRGEGGQLDDYAPAAGKEEQLDSKEKKGRDRAGSLRQDDVDELVRWVSQKS